jgi:hypothetical protein
MATKSDIHLYTTATPNGIKVSMLLEELGLEYKASQQSLSLGDWYTLKSTNRMKTTPIDISKNTQKVRQMTRTHS